MIAPKSTIKERVTTAITLIHMGQAKLIPMMYTADKSLFVAMLYAYGRAADNELLATLNVIISTDEAIEAVEPWAEWEWDDLNRIAMRASQIYQQLADQPDAATATRLDLELKALQNWTYAKAGDLKLTEYHRSRALASIIKNWEAETGCEGEYEEFLADFLAWCEIETIDFDTLLHKARTVRAENNAPTWGYITTNHKELLAAEIAAANQAATDTTDHDLVVRLLKINGMKFIEAAQYAPDMGVGWNNYHLSRWILDSFEEIA